MKKQNKIIAFGVVLLFVLLTQVGKAQSTVLQVTETETLTPTETLIQAVAINATAEPLPANVIFEGEEYENFAQLEKLNPHYTEKDLIRLELSLLESGILTEAEKKALVIARKNLVILTK